MIRTLVVMSLALVFAAAADAKDPQDPVQLTKDQMDSVTAGGFLNVRPEEVGGAGAGVDNLEVPDQAVKNAYPHANDAASGSAADDGDGVGLLQFSNKTKSK